jgi:hypothetical protein
MDFSRSDAGENVSVEGGDIGRGSPQRICQTVLCSDSGTVATIIVSALAGTRNTDATQARRAARSLEEDPKNVCPGPLVQRCRAVGIQELFYFGGVALGAPSMSLDTGGQLLA